MFDLRHLKTLVAIREAGSLADAAERLHLTQSALSHQLKDLEYSLGLSLLRRKTRPPQFTKAGERLLALADEVLPLVKNTERDLDKICGGRSGRLILAIECHSCFDWLMPTLNQFREDWPEVDIDFQSGFQGDALQRLISGELDLVVTSNPEPNDALLFLPLVNYQSLLVLGKQHALNQKSYIEPQDLATQTLIVYPVDLTRLDIFKHFLLAAHIKPAQLRTTELTLMMIQLAASHRGVCALPDWVAKDYVQRGWIKTKKLGEHGVWCTLYAAIRHEDINLPFMQDFVHSAKTSLASIQKND